MNTLHLAGRFLLLAILAVLPACGGGTDDDGKTEKGKAADKGGTTGDGNFDIVGTYYDNVNQDKAKANAADVLTRLADEKDICLVGLWAYNPPAILAAVKSAKREKKVKIVGFDEDRITLKGIRDGHIAATVVQQPFEFGRQAVRAMALLAKDPNAKLPDEVKDGIWHIDHLVITKDKVDDFEKNLDAQLEAGRQADPPAGGGKMKVAFVSNNEAEFWTIAQAGTRKGAQESGVEVLFRRPKSPTAAAQKEIIDDLLTEGVQAIAISVIDPANQKDYLNKIASKVALITVDNDAPDTKRKCYIGTNNVAAGRTVGELVKKAMPQGGKVAIFVGQPDPINAQERRQGVLDALSGK